MADNVNSGIEYLGNNNGIMVSGTVPRSEYDTADTVQSQYADSPRLKALVFAFAREAATHADIQLFFDKYFNLSTAEGVGLDIWGQILALPRRMDNIPASAVYFGFDTVGHAEANPFDNAPFYSPQATTYYLADSVYRFLLFAKARANIGTASLAELNLLLKNMFPALDIYVNKVGTMKIRITVRGEVPLFVPYMISRQDFPPMPVGVGWDITMAQSRLFGFLGQNEQPFDNGTFIKSWRQTNE